MTKKIAFELVSPESKVMAEDITMAVIPGTEGEFGVLNGHMPLVATVGTGVVAIYRDNMNDVSERVFIAGGVADVTGDQCTVLAEQAINVNDLDKADLERQMNDLREDIKITEDDSDRVRFQKKLDVLTAMHSAA